MTQKETKETKGTGTAPEPWPFHKLLFRGLLNYGAANEVICHPRLRGDVPHPVWGARYENMWLAE